MTEGELIQLALGGGIFCGALLLFSVALAAIDSFIRIIRMIWLLLTFPFRILWRIF